MSDDKNYDIDAYLRMKRLMSWNTRRGGPYYDRDLRNRPAENRTRNETDKAFESGNRNLSNPQQDDNDNK